MDHAPDGPGSVRMPRSLRWVSSQGRATGANGGAPAIFLATVSNISGTFAAVFAEVCVAGHNIMASEIQRWHAQTN